MKASFSLLEIIFVLTIMGIIGIVFVPKYNEMILKSKKVKIKSQIILIQNGIKKILSKNILLSNSILLKHLDTALINKNKEKLFSKILDFEILSSSLINKDVGKWIKISQNTYITYLNKSLFVSYSFKNNSFACASTSILCKDFE